MKRTVRHALVAVAVLVSVSAGPAQASPEALGPQAHHVTGQFVAQDDGRDDDRPAGDDDDDNGLWGLLGLLGLVGLLGLIRRGRRGEQLAGPAAEPPVARSDVITESTQAAPAQAPQQYGAPPPGQRYQQR